MSKEIRVLLVVWAAVLMVLFGIYLMAGPPDEINPTPDPLEPAISQMLYRYEQKEISAVDFSTITTFSWDRLYVFEPYTTFSYLDSKVGLSWRKVCDTDINVLEGYTLLVFVKGRKVVHCLEYPTEKYDFFFLTKYETGLQIQDAVFILDEDGYVILAKNK